MTRRDPTAGITLVEMLVALVLFALVGLASFTTLDAIIRVRDGTEGRLEQIARFDRALQLFSRDVTQSVTGGIALEDGMLTISRAGRGSLLWALRDGALVREAQIGNAQAPIVQILLPDVADLAFRFVDAAAQWNDNWPPQDGETSLAGVEMRLDLGPVGGTLLRLAEAPQVVPEATAFDVLSGGPPEEVATEPPAAGN